MRLPRATRNRPLTPRRLVLKARYAPVFDFLQVPPQPPEDFLPLCIAELLLEFFQSEVDDVMVMDLLRGNVATKFQPNTVQQINLFGREVRSMGAQIENMFLAAWEIDFEGQLG